MTELLKRSLMLLAGMLSLHVINAQDTLRLTNPSQPDKVIDIPLESYELVLKMREGKRKRQRVEIIRLEGAEFKVRLKRKTKEERKRHQQVIREVETNPALKPAEAQAMLEEVLAPRIANIPLSDVDKIIIMNKHRPEMTGKLKRLAVAGTLWSWGGLAGLLIWPSIGYVGVWAGITTSLIAIQAAAQTLRMDLDDWSLQLIKG